MKVTLTLHLDCVQGPEIHHFDDNAIKNIMVSLMDLRVPVDRDSVYAISGVDAETDAH